MKAISREILAKDIIKRFKGTKLGYKLDNLGINPSPDDIDIVTGDKRWTRVGPCEECGEYADKVVETGEDPYYNSRTTYLCIDCLIKALELIDCV